MHGQFCKKENAVRILPILLIIWFNLAVWLCPAASADNTFSGKRIVLIPLDSRPVNTEYIATLAQIGGATVVYPKDGLDLYTQPADYPKLKEFLTRELPQADAVFICIPEWLNGSLIEGRNTCSYIQNAHRLDDLKAILSPYRSKRIYLMGLIPREKPSYSGAAFKYTTELTQYGRKYTQYMLSKTITGRNYLLYFLRHLESSIPTPYVQDYLRLFNENMRVLYTLADWTKDGIVDEVVIGTDDTSDIGLPKFSQKRIKEYCAEQGIQHVHIMAGADDITALLLARYKNEITHSASQYDVTFSHEDLKNNVKAYDGQALTEVIQDKAAFVQPEEKTTVKPPVSMALYIHSQEESIDRLEHWIEANPERLRGVADVSYASFMDTGWMENYLRQELSRKIDSYAAWNTSGNTIGLLIAHMEMIRDQANWNEAHERWLALRYAEDYYYNIIKRYEYVQRYSSIKKLSPEEELSLMKGVTSYTNTFLATLSLATRRDGYETSIPVSYRVKNASLPWHRIFEIRYEWEERK
jgi:hypothetical protein